MVRNFIPTRIWYPAVNRALVTESDKLHRMLTSEEKRSLIKNVKRDLLIVRRRTDVEIQMLRERSSFVYNPGSYLTVNYEPISQFENEQSLFFSFRRILRDDSFSKFMDSIHFHKNFYDFHKLFFFFKESNGSSRFMEILQFIRTSYIQRGLDKLKKISDNLYNERHLFRKFELNEDFKKTSMYTICFIVYFCFYYSNKKDTRDIREEFNIHENRKYDNAVPIDYKFIENLDLNHIKKQIFEKFSTWYDDHINRLKSLITKDTGLFSLEDSELREMYYKKNVNIINDEGDFESLLFQIENLKAQLQPDEINELKQKRKDILNSQMSNYLGIVSEFEFNHNEVNEMVQKFLDDRVQFYVQKQIESSQAYGFNTYSPDIDRTEGFPFVNVSNIENINPITQSSIIIENSSVFYDDQNDKGNEQSFSYKKNDLNAF